jgi:hypothetical protein
VGRCELAASGSRQGMVDYCEYGNEPLIPIKDGNFLTS